MRRTLTYVLLLCLTACHPNGVEVTLAPHPRYTDAVHLAQALRRLEIVIDGVDNAPLYPAGTDRINGNPSLMDVDADGFVEVVFDVQTDGNKLPTLRIEPGPVANADVRVTLDGFDNSGARIAAGGADISMVQGPQQLPFNLLPERRAPRVASVFPNGLKPVTDLRTFSAVLVYISKRISEPTAQDAARLVRETPQGDVEVQTMIRSFPAITTQELIQINIQEPLANGTYRVIVDTQLADSFGRNLDQDPMKPGLQPFELPFVVEASEPCDDACMLNWCSKQGDVCPPGYWCSGRRLCGPLSCVRCLPDMACSTGTNASICSENCQALGTRFAACPGDVRCNEDGVCVSPDQPE